MKAGKKQHARFIAIFAMTCLVVACLSLAACGGSASSSAASSSASGSASASASASASTSSASGSSASTSGSAASSTDKFVGTWKIAAAEMEGVTMGGNFGDLIGAGSGSSSDIVINADGTGTLSFDENPSAFSWTAADADSIYISPQGTEASIQQTVQLTYKDEALFMPFEQDGRQMTAIFTKDGNYAGAKQITLDGAQPITSESTLLGTWNLVGVNMGGVSMYGDAQSIASAMSGGVSTITFKEGGALEMGSGEGSWSVSADGATMTVTDVMGTNTIPIVMLGDEIAIDYTKVFQGQTFIFVMAKK